MRSRFLKQFTLNVQHDDENQKFLVPLNPDPVTLSYQVEGGNTWKITEVNIPQSARQLHIGPRIMEYALEKALYEKLNVVPVCSYARNYMARNPRFGHLMPKESEETVS